MALPPHVQTGERVVLFDGVCRLCNGWAKFLIRHDRDRRFRLCSVQSAEGQAILAWFGLPTDAFETMAYVEGEALYLATPIAGRIDKVLVQRGNQVKAGQRLFIVDPVQLEAQRDQAGAEVSAAKAQASDARQGQRPVELAIFDANVAAAEATARDASANLRRVRPLVEKGIFAKARLDDAQSTYDAAQAQVKAAKRQREAAALGDREDQIRAADSRVQQTNAALVAASLFQ